MTPEIIKVVDSWAILAWLLDQSAAPLVDKFLQEADAGLVSLLMSWINIGEVYYIVARRLGQEAPIIFLNVYLLCHSG